MASTDDLLTAQKNLVQAVNGLTSLKSTLAGSIQTKELAVTTQVKSSSGWLATISVIVAGSSTGTVYDTNAVSNLTGNRIYIIPMTVGIYTLQVPFNSGLVVVPGSGMVYSVTYS